MSFQICQVCHTMPCCCRRPNDGRIDHYHHYGHGAFTPHTPTLEDIRRVIREELERAAEGKSA